MRQLQGIQPYESADPDSARIFWREAGVHQNLTFGVRMARPYSERCESAMVFDTGNLAGGR